MSSSRGKEQQSDRPRGINPNFSRPLLTVLEIDADTIKGRALVGIIKYGVYAAKRVPMERQWQTLAEITQRIHEAGRADEPRLFKMALHVAGFDIQILPPRSGKK